MSGIPQELIFDILLRLPVKSICRLKCVSKTWWVLLSSPSFVKAHIKLHNLDPEDFIFTVSFSEQPLHIITFTAESCCNDGISRAVNFPINDDSVWIKVGGSCHGLVLIIFNRRDERWAILMNPITLQAVEVQHCHYAKSCAYGMGYDSSKDDHVIVSISTERIVDIYSVKMRTWRRLANFPHDVSSPAPGVFLNDRIHWMTFSGSGTVLSLVLSAFNLASEEFEKVPIPSDVEFDHQTEIRAIDGCLALVRESYLGGIDVWMMKEYGVQNSWTKLITIKRSIVKSWIDVLEFICLLSKDEIVLRKHGQGLVTYNQGNGAWRDMVIADVPDRFDGVQPFRASLLSPY